MAQTNVELLVMLVELRGWYSQSDVNALRFLASYGWTAERSASLMIAAMERNVNTFTLAHAAVQRDLIAARMTRYGTYWDRLDADVRRMHE